MSKSSTVSDVTNAAYLRGPYIGVEVELEHVTQDLKIDPETDRPQYKDLSSPLVQCIRDGSLRNHGAEFVFRAPLQYGSKDFNNALMHIEQVGAAVQAVGSPRTSTHYHLNVSDCNAEQFQNILYLSLLVEPVLMKYCSENRQNNRFCVPSYQSTARLYSRSIEAMQKQDMYMLHDCTFEQSKYAAISLHRLHDLGTIEYRMFDGTYNSKEIQGAAKVLNLIRRMGMQRSLDSLRESKVQGRLLDVLSSVIRRSFGTKVSDTEIKELLDKGAVQANDALQEHVPVYKLLGELNDLLHKLEQREDSESFERTLKSFKGATVETTIRGAENTTGAHDSESRARPELNPWPGARTIDELRQSVARQRQEGMSATAEERGGIRPGDLSVTDAGTRLNAAGSTEDSPERSSESNEW